VSGYSIRSHNLLRAQRAVGIDAVALARTSRVARRAEESIDGVPYVWMPSGSQPGPATLTSSITRVAGLARQLRSEVRRRPVAVLHAHSPSLNGAPALWVGRRSRVPFVYEIRAPWEAAAVARGLGSESALRYTAARNLETVLIRCAAAVVTISQGLCEDAVRRGAAAERVVRAPNGVDTAEFHPMPRDAELACRHDLAGGIVFGYVGYFYAYEGVDILLRAFASIARTLPGSRLVLVGDGEDAALLRALAAELGVSSRVLFAGAVPHHDVPRWYSVCDVLVYPRRAGSLTALVTPLKPLEAMAMGRPVIGSAVGGLQELIRDGETGLLCRPDDPAALADALAQLGAAGERDALGARARRFACEERDWARLGPIYARLYEHVTSRPPAAA
jgi:PEP-CTERM/exosortase A-associated glycosyltransferase